MKIVAGTYFARALALPRSPGERAKVRAAVTTDT